VLCKLLRGNTYVLKARDERNVVNGLYILDPASVQVLIAPDGSVFYDISADALSGVEENVTVPAREIIHDIMVPLYHPLVGVSPIYACGMAALQGLKIQSQSAKLFANGSQPGGVLTAPQFISNETAERLAAHWNANYAGEQNIGKVVVLGDGLKYEPMTMTAVDAQLIDQLRWTDERICACFHVPLWKVSAGPMPAYGNVQAANIEYYSQALQALIENLEELLDEGLGTGINLGVEFDLDALLRMDSATQMDIAVKGVGGAIYAPNEGRKIFDLPQVRGGDTPYLQQQNYSLDALDRRDEANPAPSSTTPGRRVSDRESLPASSDENEMADEKRIDVTALPFLVHRKVQALQATT
jgi:HK97 family phage portal protein